jgi:hypothetical protein
MALFKVVLCAWIEVAGELCGLAISDRTRHDSLMRTGRNNPKRQGKNEISCSWLRPIDTRAVTCTTVCKTPVDANDRGEGCVC